MQFNRAVVGGSVYLSCYDTVNTTNVTKSIKGIKATDRDGIPDVLEPSPDGEAMKCNVQMVGTNIYMNNTAKDGGAIKWTKERPLISNTTKFINNTATVYGNNIASYPKTI
jgi:hypothetical protein